MEYQTNYEQNPYRVYNEVPDDQPPATSYPLHPDEAAPLNPSPIVPGTDAPEVNTGRREPSIPEEESENQDASGKTV